LRPERPRVVLSVTYQTLPRSNLIIIIIIITEFV